MTNNQPSLGLDRRSWVSVLVIGIGEVRSCPIKGLAKGYVGANETPNQLLVLHYAPLCLKSKKRQGPRLTTLCLTACPLFVCCSKFEALSTTYEVLVQVCTSVYEISTGICVAS